MSVSVIIPAHNAGTTIAATLASLQSEADAIGEILVVDDSSSDDTAVVALEAALKITPNARILKASCRDAGGARNLALAEASCPWIYLIDADDLHLPGGLGAMLEQVRAGADLVVGGSLRRVDGEDRKVKFSSGLGRDAISNAVMYLKGQVSSIAVGGALFSRRVMGGDRFPTGLAYDEDTLFWARLISRASMAFVDRPVMIYQVCTQRSDNRFLAKPARHFLAWRRELRRLSDCGIPSAALKAREGIVALKIARVHYAVGDFRNAARFLAVASAAPKSPSDAWRCARYSLKLLARRRGTLGKMDLQDA